ncbi:transmembrane protein 106B-like [Mya arenaria]|uniref:transmembrane protein 106B-like n=1 Tax=Mya arenaria TaxID=6604 RepID=UPI0022E0D720|nr:transmembrane protein 106B-like [Mya arenaria]
MKMSSNRLYQSENSTLMNGLNVDHQHYGSSTQHDANESEGSQYTELLRGSVPCPTCRGVGNIPKEQEGELVALIPMKDKRLRPRRTYIWVGLAVLLTLVLAGLLIFFIMPRSVDIASKRPYLRPVGAVYVNTTEDVVNFTVTNRFNVSNQNFFEIKVTSVKLTVLYDTQVISESSNFTNLLVPMRGQRQYFIDIPITFNLKNQMGYMAESCLNSIRWAHELVMMFEFTCNYEVLGHTEQSTLQTFQFVSCYSSEKPSTIAPPLTKPPQNTTTTATTTTAAITTTTTNVTTAKEPMRVTAPS